jgi:hypothetical protein
MEAEATGQGLSKELYSSQGYRICVEDCRGEARSHSARGSFSTSDGLSIRVNDQLQELDPEISEDLPPAELRFTKPQASLKSGATPKNRA